MHNDWILDVLADLKSFAIANNLDALAEQLDDTTLVAASEIASKAHGARTELHGGQGGTGSDPRSAGQHQRA